MYFMVHSPTLSLSEEFLDPLLTFRPVRDLMVRKYTRKTGYKYRSYPFTSCISVNKQILPPAAWFFWLLALSVTSITWKGWGQFAIDHMPGDYRLLDPVSTHTAGINAINGLENMWISEPWTRRPLISKDCLCEFSSEMVRAKKRRSCEWIYLRFVAHLLLKFDSFPIKRNLILQSGPQPKKRDQEKYI